MGREGEEAAGEGMGGLGEGVGMMLFEEELEREGGGGTDAKWMVLSGCTKGKAFLQNKEFKIKGL